MDAEFSLVSIDTKNYETTRISWEIAIFPKRIQNGQFCPKCKEGTLCKILEIGHFLNRNLLGQKIANTCRILA